MVSIEGLKRLPQSTGQFHFGLSEAEGVGSEAATFALLWKGLPCLGPPGLSEAALLDDITKCWKEKWRVRKEEEGGFAN